LDWQGGAVRRRRRHEEKDNFFAGTRLGGAAATALPATGITSFSLTPGFSPVLIEPPSASRFNGFPPCGKPLKRLIADGFARTGLKPRC